MHFYISALVSFHASSVESLRLAHLKLITFLGEVRTAMVKMENNRSRGMGTVSFYSSEDARRAIGILF
jgi:hypothetical protein